MGTPWLWHDYGERAIQAILRPERDHGRAARQWFTPDGPLALLPLADGNLALVWSVPSPRAKALLAMEPSELCRAIASASGTRGHPAVHDACGALAVHGPRFAQPLAMALARAPATARQVVLGAAGHRVHPLAGQGVNLGFLDAAVLAAILSAGRASGMDCGDAQLLRRYSRQRLMQQAGMVFGCHALHGLFASRLATLAGHGLGALDRIAPARRLLAGLASGRGSLPA
jgi:2-polyprenyl-6-methoxyphenol hydroxylase-like FAD-dependent oxidoreductase